MSRLIAVVALLSLSFLARTAPMLQAAGTAQSPRCILQFHANQWCYRPSEVNQAERRMAIQTVNPTAVVTAVTQLTLTQVSVTGVHFSPDAIHFIFGPAPFHHHDLLTPVQRVVVTEALARVAHNGIRIVNQANGPRGPWELTTNLPQSRLSLAITSNLGPAPLRRIAARIMQKGQHRTPYGPPTVQQLATQGMIFTPLAPTVGSISRAEAISKARAWGLAIRPSGGVSVAAQFGRFTDRSFKYHNWLAVQSRLIWLVTFFGPAIAIPSQGPCCAPHPVHHALSVVIDAHTGKALMGFS